MRMADSSQPPPLGLAGAEKRLFELNLNQGEMSVQRQVMQFRVDYLSDLNTQAVLLAGVAAGMLCSLELEAMQPEDPELHTPGRMLLVATYVLFACTSLGASVWVLYTSNNLVNSALVAQLYGSTLEDMQNAESVLAMRMLDVRKMYIVALLTVLPAQLVMVVTLITWWVSLPACAVVGWFLAHAIHADFATAWHLERYNIPLHEMRPEYWVEGVAQRFFASRYSTRSPGRRTLGSSAAFEDRPFAHFLRLLFGSTSYERLGERVTVAANSLHKARATRSEAARHTLAEDLVDTPRRPRKATFACAEAAEAAAASAEDSACDEAARRLDRQSSAQLIQRHWLQRLVSKGSGVDASARKGKPAQKRSAASAPPDVSDAGATHRGYMCKTPSDKGPSAVLHSLAIGPLGRLETLRSTPATTPSHSRWWVLDGAGWLRCYKHEAEWKDGAPPKLAVDMRAYTVARVWDPHGLLTLALVPKRVLDPPIPKSARSGGPGMVRHTTLREESERSWYLCAYPASISNSRMTEQWHELLCRASDAQPGVELGSARRQAKAQPHPRPHERPQPLQQEQQRRQQQQPPQPQPQPQQHANLLMRTV